MTPRFYRVGPSVWDEQWDDDTRLTALYLLTNGHRNTEGIFRMPLAYAYTDLGWEADRFLRAFDKLIAAGFVKYDASAHVVWIVKALAWQTPTNPNQIKGAIKALKALPKTPLIRDFGSAADRHCVPLANALREALPSAFEPQPAAVSVVPPPVAVVPATPTVPIVKHGGRPVPTERLERCEAILAAFNEAAGTSYSPYTGQGKPSDGLSRIITAVSNHPAITLEVGEQMIRTQLADPYWGASTPAPGNVFGPKVVERNLQAVTTSGRTESMAEYAARMNAINDRASAA
jgi:hypothetical protein